MHTIRTISRMTPTDLTSWISAGRDDLLNDPLLRRAVDLAVAAHSGQVREDGADFVVHPLTVARILAAEGASADVIAAGVVHDVVEDTPVSLRDLTLEVGERVGAMVFLLTKPAEHTEPPIIALASRIDAATDGLTLDAFDVKLADRRHNLWTAGALSRLRQRRMACETLEILYPAAKRVGAPGADVLRALSKRILGNDDLPIAA